MSCFGLGFGRAHHKVHPCQFVIVFNDKGQTAMDNIIVTKTVVGVNITTNERTFDMTLSAESIPTIVKLISDFCIPANYSIANVISSYSRSKTQFAEYNINEYTELIACIHTHLNLFLITQDIGNVRYPAI